MGYFEAILLQTLWLTLIVLTISTELSLFVRFFIMLGAPAKEIVANIQDFGNEFVSELSAGQITIGTRNQMTQKTIEIVQFQGEAKQFVSQLAPHWSFRLVFFRIEFYSSTDL